MSVPLYDKALKDKIKSWVMAKDITILDPDESGRFFNQVADQKKDKISLPLISISRDRNIDIQLVNRSYRERTGKTFDATNTLAQHLPYIPIGLNYQIDVYTRYKEEAYEYLRSFIFDIINYPTLEIEIPYYESNKKQKAFMELQHTASDNSDIPERLIPGQFTRVTLGITLKDAKLFMYKTSEIPRVQQIDSISGSLATKGNKSSGHYIDDSCEELSSQIIED